ncbi:hypothetical protein HYY70_01335 [Candidatus Woesearchaeota archaeon]|nr:hypothetical protein [Candidatus Woesearchaeota archaeon]
MKSRKIIDIAGTILLFIGFSLAFLPHAMHAKLGLDEKTLHIKHMVIGIALVLIALSILVYNNNSLKYRISYKKV